MSSVNATGITTSLVSESTASKTAATSLVKSEDQVQPQASSAADQVTISEEARLLLESDQTAETDDTGIEPPKVSSLDTGIEPPKVSARDTGIEPPKQK